MSLDLSRPAGQVYGLPGVQWQQDGCYFRRDGSPVSGDPDREAELRGLRGVLADQAATFEQREAATERLKAIGGVEKAPANVENAGQIGPGKSDAPASGRAGVDESGASSAGEATNKGGRPSQAEEARLRAQLEIYGEPWQSVAQARRFLEGKGA